VAVDQLASITLYISRTSPLHADRMVERILRRVDTLAALALANEPLQLTGICGWPALRTPSFSVASH
jgi:hypothetical protein